MRVDQPKHPLPELATYELRDYRRELQDALQDASGGSGLHELLERRLGEVAAEERPRAKYYQ
jgi:hypothetical protein